MLRGLPCLLTILAFTAQMCAAGVAKKLGVNGACQTPQKFWCEDFQVCSIPLRKQMEKSCCVWAAAHAPASQAPFAFCSGALAAVVHGRWGAWGACTKRCEWGVQIRECNNPRPRGGGKECSGPRTRDCNAHKCRAGVTTADQIYTDMGAEAMHRCRDAQLGAMKGRCKLLKRALRLPGSHGAKIRARFCRPGRAEFLACPKSCRRCRRHAKGVHPLTATATAAVAKKTTATTSTTTTSTTTTSTTRAPCSDTPDSGCDGLRQALAAFASKGGHSGWVKKRYCEPASTKCAKACCVLPACAADPCAHPPTPAPRTWGKKGQGDEDADEKAERAARGHRAHTHLHAHTLDSDMLLGDLHAHTLDGDMRPGDDDGDDDADDDDPEATTTTTTTSSTASAVAMPVTTTTTTTTTTTAAVGDAYAEFKQRQQRKAKDQLHAVVAQIKDDLDGAGGAMPGESLGEMRHCGPWPGAQPCPKGATLQQQHAVSIAPTPAPPTPPPTQPGEGGWSAWSTCTLNYGVVAPPGADARDKARLACNKPGRKIRTCTQPPPTNSPYFIGLGCRRQDGTRTQPTDADDGREQSMCTTAPCPIDGAWGSWSACAPSCGKARFLTRACNSPAPSLGGFDCFGPDRKPCAAGPPCPAGTSRTDGGGRGSKDGSNATDDDDDDKGDTSSAVALSGGPSPDTRARANARTKALKLAAASAARKHRAAAATANRAANEAAEKQNERATVVAAATHHMQRAAASDDDFVRAFQPPPMLLVDSPYAVHCCPAGLIS